ncbi:PKD domain-containing protein [Candidatus Bipolaricaulota sp. J31]
MLRGRTIGGVFLLMAIVAWGASAEVTFVDQGLAAGYLNPGDVGIVVQKIRVTNTSGQPVLFDVITVRNRGTATHQEIIRIELWDGGAQIGSVDDPIGLSTGGVAIPVDYTLPAGAAVDISVLVNVADVTKIAGGETVMFEVQFHYFVGTTAYTSSWIADGETEEIVKAGFDQVQETVLPAGNYNPGDGAGNPVQQVTFTDDDANNSDIQVNSITVRNLGTASETSEIQALTVTVVYNGIFYKHTPADLTGWKDGGIEIPSGAFEETSATAWDGWIDDDGSIEILVEIKVASAPTDGSTVQTEIVIELTEQGQVFTQISQAPTVQTIRNAGAENIEEQSTAPASGVLNPGEILTQTIVVRDDDVNGEVPTVTGIWIRNLGTAGDAEIAKITVKAEGAIVGAFLPGDFAGFASPGGVWLDVNRPLSGDDGSLTIQILYQIDEDITPGHTLQPRVKVKSEEPAGTGPYETASVDFPAIVELRNAGFEYAEDIAQDAATVYTGQRFVAQKIRLDDQDENDDGVTINPVVVRNLGTAQASDITRIEVRNANGDLLGETTDVAGFDTGGVTISTLQNNSVADDGQMELWIWITLAVPPQDQEATVRGRTIQLETTVHHLENGATYAATVASEAVFTIDINHRPVVDFSWTPVEPTWEDEITFIPDVTDPDGDAIVWSRWDFGDGTDPIVRDGPPETVTHTYPDGGTFTVTLTVRDARGVEGSAAKEIAVQERPNQPPQADFSWDPPEPGVGQDITFTPQATDPDGDEIVWARWDFGDGTVLELEAPDYDPTAPVTHSYGAAGTYTVTLVVRDARGAESQPVTHDIVVMNRPPLITALTYSPPEPVAGQEVEFSVTAQDPDRDPITDWEWDFDGDGNVDSTDTPPVTHTYAREGVYTVRVRARDAGGSGQWSDWYEEVIYVRRPGGPAVGAYVERNPVSDRATIVYFLPAGTSEARLLIFDLMGRLVFETQLNLGANAYTWDLRSAAGVDVPSGLYFFVITGQDVDGRAVRSAVGRILVVRRGG